jgi:hypothetical protein
MRQREAAEGAPLQHVQRLHLAHGPPLSMDCWMCRIPKSQILPEFPDLHQCSPSLRHHSAARDRLELVFVRWHTPRIGFD